MKPGAFVWSLAIAACAYWALSALDRADTPQTAPPPPSAWSSTNVSAAASSPGTSTQSRSPASPPLTDSRPASTVVTPRHTSASIAAAAAAAATGYLRALAVTAPGERLAVAGSWVVPTVADTPPLVMTTGQIPFSQLTGPAQVVAIALDETSAAVTVPTDTGPISLEVQLLAGRWLVSNVVSPE